MALPSAVHSSTAAVSACLAQYGLAVSAGVTIYVAASNLIPEAQRERGLVIPGGVFLGVAAFYLTRLILPDA
jgi:ZIP family zinc transporter/zinc and cadmium transporter